MSEYGMQSLPSHEKLIAVNGGREIRLDDPLLNNIQKSYKGNRLLLKYMEDRYGSIQSTEAFCYLSQLHQADAMTLAIESHRMGIPKCMGTLYWQLNDVWDGASWSTIEADGRWKAAHYDLKRLYRESLVSVNIVDNQIKGQFQRHVPDGSKLNWVLQLKDFNGAILKEITDTFYYKSSTPLNIFNFQIDSLLQGLESSQVAWVAQVISQAQVLTEAMGFFVKPKELKLKDPKIKVESLALSDRLIQIEISVESFAPKIFLSAREDMGLFSNNYLTVFPGQNQTVYFFSTERVDHDALIFKVHSLFDFLPKN
jgi:beta-mannosidase